MIIKEFTMVVMVIIRHVYVTSFQRSPVLLIMVMLTPQIEHHFSRSRYPPVHKKRYDVDHDYEISHFNYIPIILHDTLIACSPRLISLPGTKTVGLESPARCGCSNDDIMSYLKAIALVYPIRPAVLIPLLPQVSGPNHESIIHYCTAPKPFSAVH